jgi:hypothetical protein
VARTSVLHKDVRMPRENRKSVAASMKITQEVRDYAKAQGVSEQDALKKGMKAKAVEFVKQGAEVYKKAWRLMP